MVDNSTYLEMFASSRPVGDFAGERRIASSIRFCLGELDFGANMRAEAEAIFDAQRSFGRPACSRPSRLTAVAHASLEQAGRPNGGLTSKKAGEGSRLATMR